MSDTKISALPNAATLVGSEQIPIVQGGVDVKTSPNALFGMVSGAVSIAAGGVATVNTVPASALPIASGSTLGGIKIGSGLSINGSGVVTATGGGGGGTSALWSSVSFAQTIPLDALKYMPLQIVTGALTFIPASSPSAGASCSVCLVADGTNLPTFSGFNEAGTSSGYNNTAGVLNNIMFWYDGNNTPWFSVFQPVNLSVIPIPFFSSAQITSGAPDTIQITFTTPLLTTQIPSSSAFSLPTASGGAYTVSSISISGAVVSIVCSRNFTGGETFTGGLGYTAPVTNPLIDSTSVWLAQNFSGKTITNNLISNPVVWVGNNVDIGTAASTQTFTNIGIGSTPASNRQTVFAVGWVTNSSGATVSLSSATINGSSATIITSASNSNWGNGIAFVTASNISGTTATLELTFSGNTLATATAYEVYTSSSVLDSKSVANMTGGATSTTTASAGDILIGATFNYMSGSTTLTGSSTYDSNHTASFAINGEVMVFQTRSVANASAGSASLVGSSSGIFAEALVRW